MRDHLRINHEGGKERTEKAGVIHSKKRKVREKQMHFHDKERKEEEDNMKSRSIHEI